MTTVVLCRASVLQWVHRLEENEAVIVLNDAAPLEAWLAAARHLHQEWPIDTVASLAEIDQDKAAAIAEHLGIDFHSPEVVRRCHDKTTMREQLNASGVEKTPFRQVASAGELAEFYAEVGPPLLVKPSKGRASAGIAVVRSEADVERAFTTSHDARAPRLEHSLPLAERFIEGPEFSVEVVTHQGHHYVFAITEKFKDEATKVELGHVVPARIPDVDADRILAHVRACLTALGITSGITHTEVILGADGPVLVETHLRQAGDEIAELVEIATGVDITELFLRQLAGESIADREEVASRAERPHYLAAGAIRYLAPPQSGRLAGIDGLAEARALEGVQDVTQLVEDGSALSGLHSSYSRLASARVAASDADTAVRRAEEAVAVLGVRVAEEA
ncbi:ATP-grasp domain-containing protein [Kitasatospora sp. NPDC093550]|uniref:ATP-grasp domain-containing protein n=1 Tax=Kitasatospora sp. NPDC093550 TaxID=3364089 RepID=UPI00382EB2B0